MNPIVDGIAQDYQGKVDVRKLNAIGNGEAAFEYYRMRGHPSYVLLKPDGTRVWSDIGLRTREQVVEQLEMALSAQKAQ